MTEEQERQLFDSIVEIKCAIKQIRSDLAEDYKVLHGNGHAGLIERMTITETSLKWAKTIAGLCGVGASLAVKVISTLLGINNGN